MKIILVPIGKGIVRRPGKDVTIVGKLLTMYRRWPWPRSWRKTGSTPR